MGGGDLVEAIEGLDRPIIGAINGVAITGGFELALACDVLIASTRARFADTHARVGIMPGWGLVNHVVAPEELLPRCRRLAEDMLSCEPSMVPAYKRVIDEGFAETLREGRRIEGAANRAHAASVTPEAIAERRQRVMERGRSQGSG